MKRKAVWLSIAGLTTFSLVTAGTLGSAAQQMWTPEMTHAARVTANLLKGKSITPIILARGNQSASRSLDPFTAKIASSDQLISYTLNRQLPSQFSSFQVGSKTRSLGQVQKSVAATSNKSISNIPSDRANDAPLFELANGEFQNWPGSVEGTLKKQNYQIKKLEFELATEQYKDGTINRTAFNQKAVEYELASQEFKGFLNSSKMANE
jgi:hypothetical protein